MRWFLLSATEVSDMTELTSDRLQTAAAAYRERQPFYRVEADRLETLPKAFAEGSYLWKDVEWVVRWYARRPLTGEHREPEAAFRENDMGAVERAIDACLAAEGATDKLNALLALAGVDVPIGTAFLQYMDPERYLVMGQPEWQVLREAGRLRYPWPDTVTPADYEAFLVTCQELASEHDLSLLAVGRALWQCGDRPV